jgi:ABC-2 type transport system ATP-binding protein
MPVLVASSAGVRHRRRWVFRDLDVSVEPGETVAVVGPPGSGRTTVLLALAGRFKLSTGKIDFDGTGALAHVNGVAEPEPVFTVTEHVQEQTALLGRAAVAPAGLDGLDPAAKGWELSPYQKQVLGLILARMSSPSVIALDGLDDGLDAGEQRELWELIDKLAAAGIAVLVTARDVDPSRVTTLIRLTDGGAAVTETRRPGAATLPAAAETRDATLPAAETRGAGVEDLQDGDES